MREDIKRVFDGIELSSEAKDTIFNRCIEKKHVRNIRIRYAGQIAVAAIAAVVLVFGSGTVYAAVSLYQAYMDKMSEESGTRLFRLEPKMQILFQDNLVKRKEPGWKAFALHIKQGNVFRKQG